jgi:hypothetical protein
MGEIQLTDEQQAIVEVLQYTVAKALVKAMQELSRTGLTGFQPSGVACEAAASVVEDGASRTLARLRRD